MLEGRLIARQTLLQQGCFPLVHFGPLTGKVGFSTPQFGQIFSPISAVDFVFHATRSTLCATVNLVFKLQLPLNR